MLGDASDGGPQLEGALPQDASRVAEHRVDVFPERDAAAPSSLVWCRDAQACATYGTWCATAIAVMSFRFCVFPQPSRPAGLVVVEAANGVAPERWTPVFMYASLS